MPTQLQIHLSDKKIVFNLEREHWNKVGSGSYNYVFLSPKNVLILDSHKQWVLKQCIDNTNAMSTAERSVRKWHEINPDIPAYVVFTMQNQIFGWITPYLGDKPANDTAIACKVLEHYRDHRILIVDACGLKNALEYNGKAVFIDVDLACKFHRGSFSSDDYKKNALEDDTLASSAHLAPIFISYFKKWSKWKPKTTTMIQNILYIERCLTPGKEAVNWPSKIPHEWPSQFTDDSEIPNCFLTDESLNIITDYRKNNIPITDFTVQKLCILSGHPLPSADSNEDYRIANAILNIYLKDHIIIKDFSSHINGCSRQKNLPKTCLLIKHLLLIEKKRPQKTPHALWPDAKRKALVKKNCPNIVEEPERLTRILLGEKPIAPHSVCFFLPPVQATHAASSRHQALPLSLSDLGKIASPLA